MGKVLCILAIGQSRRGDIIPLISKYLPKHVSVIEKGILDNLSEKEIHAITSKKGEKTLVQDYVTILA